jgi:signal transduction histidine kinase
MAMPSDPAELLRQLKQLEQLQACFQEAVAHELPNLLIALRGLLRLVAVEQGDRLGSEGREYLNRLDVLSQRAQTLTATLAALGRARRQPLPNEEILLTEVAREAAAEISQLYPVQRIEYHFPMPGFSLVGSRPTLRRALVHLIAHAVALAADRPLHVEVGGRETPTGPEFWVADEGPGVSAEHLRQLQALLLGQADFKPGADLGLMLVRQLLAPWGGALTVASAGRAGLVRTAYWSAAKER